MTEQEIQREVLRLSPFHHKIDLPYNLSTHVPEVSRRKIESTRVANLVMHAFPALVTACGGNLDGMRVLDAACNCGGFTVEATKLGCDFVLGIDVVSRYIEQAKFVQRALSIQNADFRIMDIERVDEDSVGSFDVTFCFGILYHLENPVLAMKRLSSVTKKVLIVDTRLFQFPNVLKPYLNKPMWKMNIPVTSEEDSLDSSTSQWRRKEKHPQFLPNESAVLELLDYLGFAKIEKIIPDQKGMEKRYYKGRRATFVAIR